MTNPSNLVITGLDGYFILNFLQKSGFKGVPSVFLPFYSNSSNVSPVRFIQEAISGPI